MFGTSSLKNFIPLLALALLVGCGGSKSGNNGYDPNYGAVGPLDRNSVPAQKLMSTAWCTDRGGPARAYLFSPSGDLQIERLGGDWQRNWRGFSRGRGRGPGIMRGTWGLQDLQLFVRAPGHDGVYYIDMNSSPRSLVLRESNGGGGFKLRACGAR